MSTLATGCGGAAPKPAENAAPASPTPASGASNASQANAGANAATNVNVRSARIDVLLRPIADPTPILHVEVTADSERPSLRQWHIVSAAPDAILNVAARDDSGAIEAKLAAANGGATLTLGREPMSAVRISYDLRANVDAPAKPLGQLVLADRFRVSGEGALVLPDALDDVPSAIELRVDGAALHAPNVASSFGIGTPKRTKGRGRVLRRATFLGGSMGAAIFDAIEGHDEAAWLGYTAFDPRPASAEIAQVRTAMGELFGSRDEPPFTLLFATQTRPLGSFTTTARAASILVQMGPSEPWGAALRLSIAQQMIHTWIGGELWIGPTDREHEAESYWFTEGVARFETMHVLARLGLLGSSDVRDAIAGETSVISTSAHRGKSNAELAAAARTDETARAHLVARGALYAAAVNGRIRARTKQAKSLEPVILALLARARTERKALPVSAWTDELAKIDPSESAAFDAAIVRGVEPVLPDGAIGPCFRAGSGEYVAFDLGYDDAATREEASHVVIGLRADGPAAKGGLKAGDVIEEAEYRDGHADVPAKLTIKRDGAKQAVTFVPRGVARKGQTWTRVAGIGEERCVEAL